MAVGQSCAAGRVVIVLLVIFAAATFIGSIMTGAADASLSNVVRWLLGASDADQVLSVRDRIIILDIRLPRAVLGMLVGASLAVSGVVMQGLFRNPLADPGLVGVSSGASLGAVLLIVLGSAVFGPLFALFGFYALPVAAFIGGLVTTLLLYRIATRGGQTSIATLLSRRHCAWRAHRRLHRRADLHRRRQATARRHFLGSRLACRRQLDEDRRGRADHPVVARGHALLARGLNAITLGEAAAFHMGIPVQRMKNIAIVSVAAATGASVAVSGGIGFVGIVVPHLLRLVIGPDHRYLVPASALLGGTLLILADVIARTIASPAELPIGIVTAFIGAPFFLWILLRGRTTMGL